MRCSTQLCDDDRPNVSESGQWRQMMGALCLPTRIGTSGANPWNEKMMRPSFDTAILPYTTFREVFGFMRMETRAKVSSCKLTGGDGKVATISTFSFIIGSVVRSGNGSPTPMDTIGEKCVLNAHTQHNTLIRHTFRDISEPSEHNNGKKGEYEDHATDMLKRRPPLQTRKQIIGGP